MKTGTLVLMIVLSVALSGITGCYKMGKATGKAAENIEDGAHDFKQGYEDAKD